MRCDVTDEAGAPRRVRRHRGRRADSAPSSATPGSTRPAPSRKLATAEYERIMALNANRGDDGGARDPPPSRPRGGRNDRQHGLVLRSDGGPLQPRLLRVEGGGRGHDPLPRAEWAADGIRVINVAPGYVEDGAQPRVSRPRGHAPLHRVAGPPEAPRPARGRWRGSSRPFSRGHPYLTGETIYLGRLARDRPLTGAHPPGGTAVSGDSPVHIHQPGRSP